ncbi:bifunctional 4-hydroxy-2-oxoglutarate aldolase/2-dehydro-3-deoxy-phosphogluconate aldolase [Leptolyngbya sp. KIOST-1]|uniref:bifunctional 4-hydroxy-2-oxoglutarate aldolase/2-dehydro-3-deoxy-phosphogluconate aldolase n=1 Tax=Leptolyngbya sp. KIOST-1 TaxID=1229172 RepID=UPI00056C26E4|nr:bifunctional 4-hydroxy-2-oxoglutarate aldolase/2-dehydro-3-deoxy-phosphogluconate aldolase [Leptolyngbya sp. KIOST-1]
MDRDSFLALLRQHRAIAVIRAADVNVGLQQAQAAAAGGLRLIEITWNSASPEDLVHKLRHYLPHCTVGIGTALCPGDLRDAAAAGAQFCFCPHTDPELIHLAQDLHIPLVPGALTPNEIVAAWRAGAAAVKVFPISAVGGASYIRSLRGPLGHIPLVPTGGVSVDSAASLIQAGAIAVGLSSELFPRSAVAAEDWGHISQLSSHLNHSLTHPV